MGSRNSKRAKRQQKSQSFQQVQPTPNVSIPQKESHQNKVINVYFRDNPFSQQDFAIRHENYVRSSNPSELKTKLENEFDRYDRDAKGFLDKLEVKKVLEGVVLMAKLDGNQNANELVRDLLNQVETKDNGKVFKSKL